MKQIAVPVPPLAEQQEIADFLDRETAKIDKLIAKQEQLITTLGERRIEVLRKLLTTGNADVTDIESSGLLWAPLINKRWNLAPLKWSATISSGSNPDSIGEQSEQNRIEVIGGNGVLGFTSSPNAEAGMIAIGRVGALCGNIHLLDKPTWISDNALRLAPSHKYDPRYLAALLQARGLNELANRTAQPLLVGSLVMNERLPIPPLQSQKEIMTRHEVVRSAIHELVSKTKEMILLLSERRQSLVTAAVTGKLEVSH
jgi:type I restriction enzyme S subunit